MIGHLVRRASALRSPDYSRTPDQRIAHRAANRRYRQRLKPSQHVLPFRVPCPTPIQAKVWMPPTGSVALSLLGRVYR